MRCIPGILLILISPLLIGLPWAGIGGVRGITTRICFAYVAGYFLRLTLFHAVALPMTVLGTHFSTMSDLFTGLLLVACAVSALLGRDALKTRRKKRRLTAYDVIYGSVCVGLILFQVYMAIVMDPTTMTYDDAVYTVYSSDALVTNYMFTQNAQTGYFSRISFRIIQSSLLFPAYIARMTGMPVTAVERTFSYALNILLAYGCYTYMAEDLYKRVDNRLIFLILVSAIYIFGYHSHYSMAFRLLGPNSQGKAILAVTLVPLLFVLLRKWLERSYDWRSGLFLFLLSDAACALSLMGVGYVIAIVALIVILSLLRKQRQWKHLLYILWAAAMPCIYAGIFLLMNNLV